MNLENLKYFYKCSCLAVLLLVGVSKGAEDATFGAVGGAQVAGSTDEVRFPGEARVDTGKIKVFLCKTETYASYGNFLLVIVPISYDLVYMQNLTYLLYVEQKGNQKELVSRLVKVSYGYMDSTGIERSDDRSIRNLPSQQGNIEIRLEKGQKVEIPLRPTEAREIAETANLIVNFGTYGSRLVENIKEALTVDGIFDALSRSYLLDAAMKSEISLTDLSKSAQELAGLRKPKPPTNKNK